MSAPSFQCWSRPADESILASSSAACERVGVVAEPGAQGTFVVLDSARTAGAFKLLPTVKPNALYAAVLADRCQVRSRR